MWARRLCRIGARKEHEIGYAQATIRPFGRFLESALLRRRRIQFSIDHYIAITTQGVF